VTAKYVDTPEGRVLKGCAAYSEALGVQPVGACCEVCEADLSCDVQLKPRYVSGWKFIVCCHHLRDGNPASSMEPAARSRVGEGE
jgi:hypothetical protein